MHQIQNLLSGDFSLRTLNNQFHLTMICIMKGGKEQGPVGRRGFPEVMQASESVPLL